MCSLCGALGQGPSWEQEGLTGDDARWRLYREAAATATELTRLLAPARIKVTARPDFGFLVAFPTGRTEMVAGLNEVWHLLARHKLEIPDPLDTGVAVDAWPMHDREGGKRQRPRPVPRPPTNQRSTK